MRKEETKIAVIGLGYVGLPLGVAFAKLFPVVGFDTNAQRVQSITDGKDNTLEVSSRALAQVLLNSESFNTINSIGFFPSANNKDIENANIYIVTVPTPIDESKRPNLEPLLTASKMIAEVLEKNDIVIYESTVYPGCTEEDCVPVLEKYSGLKFNKDFFCGYSPERISPGDKINTLTTIKKVTSGSTKEIGGFIDELYKSIITAGTYLAPSIKVAEASKAIENAQRDVNISFVNELALIFDQMNLDTNEVLKAAGTKWNFLPFKPGLVGGHCISVDPYYLVHKAESLGYHPAVILSGRRVNDQMGIFVANKLVKMMIKKEIPIKGAKVLILGITFKENCPDTRNTKVLDIHKELLSYNTEVYIYDPWADKKEVYLKYGIKLVENIDVSQYQGIILAVGHTKFLEIDFNLLNDKKVVVFDTKNILNTEFVDASL